MAHPRPLFRLFSSFQTNTTILTTNKCKKCPSIIRRWDSNSQPYDYESPHLTTRPGLPPKLLKQCYLKLNYIRTLVVLKWPILAVSAQGEIQIFKISSKKSYITSTTDVVFLQKWANLGLFFVYLFSVFLNKQYNFYNKSM